MHLSDIELALGAPASPERVRGGGLYAWADADGVVLFIGESSSVWSRMHQHDMLRARAVAASHAQRRTDFTASGLTAVLGRATDLLEGCWPIDGAADRVALRDGLVRLAAILGATPAGQGAESDVWHELRDGGRVSRAIISTWSHADHPLQRLVPEVGGSAAILTIPPTPARRARTRTVDTAAAASTRR